ncbi:MAG: hypothetical protein HQL41_04655 [Alphaproteobacteria bacterium]|nr:hypothetical protein [Alphaproteobacteria bacterium]
MANDAAPFSFPHLAARWLAALFVVLATYNPSGNSYWHWLVDGTDERWSLKLLIGLALLILNLTLVLATLRSLGALGVVTAAAFFGTVIWTMWDLGLLRGLETWTWVTIALVTAGSILGIGVSWSYIRGRMSGQIDSNDITLR